MLIHFDSGYLQPDTSFNEAVSKVLILIVICQKIGHYFSPFSFLTKLNAEFIGWEVDKYSHVTIISCCTPK